MELAPVVLFAYNRPMHTRRTMEALIANDLAAESDLFVFSDGPKNSEALASVNAVRTYLRGIGGFRSVTIVEREKNLGLAESIVTGVTEIVNRFGSIIVLEDDLETAPFFLRYMNDALKIYKDEDKVMHIAGYMYPINITDLPQTFFYRQTSCWGWATWQRAWFYFEPDAKRLASRFDPELRYRFNIEGTYDFCEHLRLNCTDEWKTWAIKWYASVFLHGGLCLHTACSLVANIGLDASGSNCNSTRRFDITISREPVQEFITIIEENIIALARIRKFLRPSRIFRLFRMVISLFRVRKTT